MQNAQGCVQLLQFESKQGEHLYRQLYVSCNTSAFTKIARSSTTIKLLCVGSQRASQLRIWLTQLISTCQYYLDPKLATCLEFKHAHADHCAQTEYDEVNYSP